MVRMSALRRIPLVLAAALALVLASPAAAGSPPPPPPGGTVEEADAAGLQAQLQAELEGLLCTVLSPLCGLLGGGEGEEGSSMDPFGAR